MKDERLILAQIVKESLPLLNAGNDILLSIYSYLDLSSLLKLGRLNKSLYDLVCEYRKSYTKRKQEWIFPNALKEFYEIFSRRPQKLGGGEKTERNDRLDIGRLSLFHEIVSFTLKAVNQTKIDVLNIVTGEDLLRSVGRLSMMISNADYLPLDETSPLPMNWRDWSVKASSNKLLYRVTSDERWKIHKSINQIKVKLTDAMPDLLNVGKYESPSTLVKRNLLCNALSPLLPKFFNMIAEWQVDDIKKHAQRDKLFLVLAGFTPPYSLFKDTARKTLIAKLAMQAAKSIASKEISPDQVLNYIESKAKIEIKPDVRESVSSQLIGIAKHISTGGPVDQYGMYLPWGNNYIASLINLTSEDDEDLKSVRLIFSQGLQILAELGDESGAADLSYKNIVRYLNEHKLEHIEEQIKKAFYDLNETNNPFVGELVILLVGIEGSQNNLTVLHAPMITDLVCDGYISWEEALHPTDYPIPYFAMAAHGSKKGKLPMLKHSNEILKYFGKGSDEVKATPEFYKFIDGEYQLHDLFLKCYWPELSDYEENDQLVLSALIIKNYLLDTFFTNPAQGAELVNKSIADFLKGEL